MSVQLSSSQCKSLTMPVTVCGTAAEVSRELARLIAGTVARVNQSGEICRLLLQGGPALEMVYRELVRLHKSGELTFAKSQILSLCDYYPMGPADPRSLNCQLKRQLIEQVDLPCGGFLSLDGSPGTEEAVWNRCRAFGRALNRAPIHFALIAPGYNGSIGFNEPGTTEETTCGFWQLSSGLRRAVSGSFFGVDNTPERGLTAGIDEVLKARQIAILTTNEGSASAVPKFLEQAEPPDDFPLRYLISHPQVSAWLDLPAAAELGCIKQPWCIDGDSVKWDDQHLAQRAVIWLSGETGKPISDLTAADFAAHRLDRLTAAAGDSGKLVRSVHRRLSGVVRRDLGGLMPPGSRVLVTQPHPDDIEYQMGGTLQVIRGLPGVDIYSAAMTSGNIAVWDKFVLQVADRVDTLAELMQIRESAARRLRNRVLAALNDKRPGAEDCRDVLDVKAAIRRSEALFGHRELGIPLDRVEFLGLPFYETGGIVKAKPGTADLVRLTKYLGRIRPTHIFLAGDLTDPHGTHRTCYDLIFSALEALEAENFWGKGLTLLLYRGAWQEWPIAEIDLAVPLRQCELERQERALCRHKSQVPDAMFGGSSEEPFNLRAKRRKCRLAQQFAQLGLNDVEQFPAMEAFRIVRYRE